MNLLFPLTVGGFVHCEANIPQALNNWSLAAAGMTGITAAGSGSTEGTGSTEDATVVVSGTEMLHIVGIETAAVQTAGMLTECLRDLNDRLLHMTI